MEKDTKVVYKAREFVPDNTVSLNNRIYDHDLDYKNWHLALLDEKNSISLINQKFENLCTFEKTHREKINMLRCLDEHVVTVADDKRLKFWNKQSKKMEASLQCRLTLV